MSCEPGGGTYEDLDLEFFVPRVTDNRAARPYRDRVGFDKL